MDGIRDALGDARDEDVLDVDEENESNTDGYDVVGCNDVNVNNYEDRNADEDVNDVDADVEGSTPDANAVIVGYDDYEDEDDIHDAVYADGYVDADADAIN